MIIPDIKVPIIKKDKTEILSLREELQNKKSLIFGIPGAFTPTCSDDHFPGYIKLYNKIIKKGIDDIYCLAVNDKYVMQSWLVSYSEQHSIFGIADGNCEITKSLNLLSDKTSNYMGVRCKRFAMLVSKNEILSLKIENPGELKVSTADNFLQEL